MMKGIIGFCITCACLFGTAHAQVNMVLNGGFEQYSSCPTIWNQIKNATYWQAIDSIDQYPLCAPEFCHTCAGSNVLVGVPVAVGYSHYPRSGNGMVSNLFYFDSTFVDYYQRNYTQGKLYDHLVSGKNYCVTFYLTLQQASQYAINGVGAYFDDGSISAGQDSLACSFPQTAFVPQVFGTAIINDTINWVKVQGAFVASGTERFVTIGNFFDNAHTDTVQLSLPGGNYSFYLLDDVSVIESTATAFAGTDALIGAGDTIHIGSYEDGMPCEWYVLGGTTPIGYGGSIDVHPASTTSYVVMLDLCGHVTYDTVKIYVVPAGVSSLSFPSSLINIYPNPSSEELHIDQAANCTVTIADIIGHTLLYNHLSTANETIDISTLPPGIYMVLLADEKTGNRAVKRIIKE